MTRADTQKADSGKVLTVVRNSSEQPLVVLNVALVRRDKAEKLTCLLVTESINAVDVVVLLLG